MEHNNEAALNIAENLQSQRARTSPPIAKGAKILLQPVDPATLQPGKAAPPSALSWVKSIPLITPYGVDYVTRQVRSLAKGRSSALTTRLGGDKSIHDLFAELRELLTPTLTDERLKLLAQFEEENALKTSPMSVQYPFAEREPALQQYFTDPGGDVTDDELISACELVKKFIGVQEGRLRPLSLESGMERMPKATQWGLPYCVRGVERDESLDVITDGEITTIGYKDYRHAYLQLAEQAAQDLNHLAWSDPCLMGWRGDLGKPSDSNPIGTKQRVVWMYPHAISIIESAYYSVLTDYLRGKPGFAAWMTQNETAASVVALLEQALGIPNTTTWAFDASAFDQHLNQKLIESVSRYIVQPLFQKGSHELIDKLSEFSMTCGMVTPNGVLQGRHYNRPSGSGGTNLLDCLENLVMFFVCMHRVGAPDEELLNMLKQVMGDDGLYNLTESFLPELEGTYAQAFGAKVNTAKEVSGVGETIYLRRVYILQAQVVAAASAFRVVAKGKNYERPTPANWSQYLDEIRWISQLETLTGHPQWKDVVDKYVSSWAPLKLGLSLEGGPRQLWRIAYEYSQGRTLDEVLDREDWSRQYRGYSVDDPDSMKVVSYLDELYAKMPT